MSKHGNILIVQSREGAQYSHNTAHVNKLLRNRETQSKQEETVTEAYQTQEEPIQQQSMLQGPNMVETKAPPERHAAAEPEVPLRRSQRQSRAPSYLKDYFTCL